MRASPAPATTTTPRWRLLGVRPPQCPFGTHRVGASLDESARRLSHSEYAVATQLSAEGHRVRAVPESRSGGRVPDLEVCGGAVEVKTWDTAVPRAGRSPTPRSVYNKLVAAHDQAPTAVLWARGSGLRPLDVQHGVAMFAASGRFGGIQTVRVIGDGFDLAWGHQPDLRPAFGPPVPRRDSPGPAQLACGR